VAADILHAIRSGRDLWLFDQVVEGPDRLERACNLLIERRAACSDPDEAAFLTTVIRGLEKATMMTPQRPDGFSMLDRAAGRGNAVGTAISLMTAGTCSIATLAATFRIGALTNPGEAHLPHKKR